ncbi:haloacid dehalogenase, type II [Halothiobacillus diazotrophicus]|uniref:(S)-2-haloacid dehalogenase n=2 Tax=Halothiobacillus diazotrophicus TaxID=1860122 RepID=A0A191ZFD9_9GAMM|nr:haloacid dehalogenase, type II [Halothiobacillus diazotrophicus]
MLPFDRRAFLSLAAAGIASGVLTAMPLAQAGANARIKAIAFDAFPVFDPRPVFALAEQLFPGKGAALSNAWRTRQFEYQWLRVIYGRYVNFWQATDDALVFAAELLNLDLTPEKRSKLMNAYLELNAWSDAPPALRELKRMGFKLALLSNATPKILDAGINNAGLMGVFDKVLSTDAIRSFKPDPRAYQMAMDAFKLPREAILFVAFAGWDAAGAKSFGYPTYWVNRLGLPAEKLGALPDGSGKTLTDLVAFVNA